MHTFKDNFFLSIKDSKFSFKISNEKGSFFVNYKQADEFGLYHCNNDFTRHRQHVMMHSKFFSSMIHENLNFLANGQLQPAM